MGDEEARRRSITPNSDAPNPEGEQEGPQIVSLKFTTSLLDLQNSKAILAVTVYVSKQSQNEATLI